MRQTITYSCVLMLLLARISLSEPSTQPATQPAAQPAVPIIELRGDGAAMGAAHGKSLTDGVNKMHTVLLDKLLEDLDKPAMFAGATAFQQQLHPEHLAEIKALATAAGVQENKVMLANCILDLEPMQGCSTISLPADASPDGIGRFARNVDFPPQGILDRATVVLVYHPTDGRYGFATIGWPGIVGAFSAMNEHGLAVANMEVTRPGSGKPRAMPYALLYRLVVERCRTTDEAIDLLKKTPRQTPNNLMIMDALGNRAVVELTQDAVVVRAGKPATAVISTNHQRGEDADTAGKCDRYDYLHDTAKARAGKLNVDVLEEMLRHVQQDELTIQSMIFEPSNRIIYLAVGARAAEHTFEKIELKKYFGK